MFTKAIEIVKAIIIYNTWGDWQLHNDIEVSWIIVSK